MGCDLDIGRRITNNDIASITSRNAVVRGCPFVLRVGMKGARNAHSRSVISLA